MRTSATCGLHRIAKLAIALSAPALSCASPDRGPTPDAELSVFAVDASVTGRVTENNQACVVDAHCFLGLQFADTSIVASYGFGLQPTRLCTITTAASSRAFEVEVGDIIRVVIGDCGPNGLYLRRFDDAASDPESPQNFSDSFEEGLGGWEVYGDGAAFIGPANDPDHGQVLVLRPRGDAYALVRQSEQWGGLSMEGEVLFPTDEHNYLGFVYAFQKHGDRADFGLIYIKGNGSYLRVNPHRDFNVGRTLYEEYRTPLVGRASIRIGEWQRFRVEIVGNVCHVYVGDMDRPQLTFSDLELSSGAIGLQPRSVGGDVWVDNVSVTPIAALSYRGSPIPDVTYAPDSVLDTWQVAGPFPATDDRLGRDPQATEASWRDFATDARGAVVTASVVDYHGPNSVAYFRTSFEAAAAGPATLHLSTVDDLSIWVNGRFHWFLQRDDLAWWDFWANDDHVGQRIPITLREGRNELVVRVRGGVYASGGFFSRVEH